MSKAVNLIFPHQLFYPNPLLENQNDLYLIEETLFFHQYAFHLQKIAFQRASMKHYADVLEKEGKKVIYIDATNELADIRRFSSEIEKAGISEIRCLDICDDWLEKRLNKVCKGIKLSILDSPQFLNNKEDLKSFFRSDKKSFFQTSFYKQQRQKRGILVDEAGQPEGGKWTFDSENRKKYPKGKTPPSIHFPASNAYWDEAVDYTRQHFSKNPGKLDKTRIYPINHEEAKAWFEQFLSYRFFDFGAYEDAIESEQFLLNHSLLSPLLNNGLLLPHDVVERSLAFAESHKIPLNSTEGFIRQMIGWREFIRGMYWSKGTYSRTRNYWGFTRKIPASFYEGTTGIPPIDQTIKKVLKTGYLHHIERLMVLGNFMLLCEFDPDEVYRWFMELFIDACDWVMVPNVYGMCLFADGGTFATKPYISGSSYLKKMSNYPKGDWEEVWDALFWRFMATHKEFFLSNPRTSMLIHTYSKMTEEKKKRLEAKASQFLRTL